MEFKRGDIIHSSWEGWKDVFLLGWYKSQEGDFESLYSLHDNCSIPTTIGTGHPRQDREATEEEKRELRRKMAENGLMYSERERRVVGAFEHNLRRIVGE